MFDSLRFTLVKFNIFSTLSFILIVLIIIYADSIISNVSLHSHNHHLVPPPDVTQTEPIIVNGRSRKDCKSLDILENSGLANEFEVRIGEFLARNQCDVQFFMTWISPVDSFSEREFLALESVFQTNPRSCLVILSSSMDSLQGKKVLDPLIDRGFRIRAFRPNLQHLFKDTPAENWLNDINNGVKDPGEIPLAQNLSNLIRLAVLYRYGGVYLDADFIILKDFSSLRNTIGAQSVNVEGNWTRLNNAVLVFEKGHPLVYKFIEEFASTFDGSRWGHNGPYLVSRVVDRVAKSGEYNFTVLPPMAFYPVDWTRVAGFFSRPNNSVGAKWVEAKIRQLRGSAYGVHLWNRESRKLKIEEGSIISRLIANQCVICSRSISSSLEPRSA